MKSNVSAEGDVVEGAYASGEGESLVQILSRQIAEKETEFQKYKTEKNIDKMKDCRLEIKDLKEQWRKVLGREIEHKKKLALQKKSEGDNATSREFTKT